MYILVIATQEQSGEPVRSAEGQMREVTPEEYAYFTGWRIGLTRPILSASILLLPDPRLVHTVEQCKRPEADCIGDHIGFTPLQCSAFRGYTHALSPDVTLREKSYTEFCPHGHISALSDTAIGPQPPRSTPPDNPALLFC
jgi:hypothetical protein